MGQVHHGSATTTAAVRPAIQHSQESLRALAKRYGINPKTVAKWKKRTSTSDQKTGPIEPQSTVLSVEDEAVIVAFRRHTLLPLDDCLYALQSTIPHLTRSSLHRCLSRHGISRLPEVEGDKPVRKRFKHYPLGYFHVDIAGVQTAEGKLSLFVAIDRTSKFAFAQLHLSAGKMEAAQFLRDLVAAVPYAIHTVLTEFEGSEIDPVNRFPGERHPVHQPDLRQIRLPHLRSRLRRERHRASPDQSEASLEFEGSGNDPVNRFPGERTGRADEPHDQGRHRQTLPLRRPRPVAAPPRRLPQCLPSLAA